MQEQSLSEQLFMGGGEMGALMRSHDWSTTPLGNVEHWSPSLKVAVNICLNSRFPMVIWWGEELTLIYNDAWRPILGNKHPQALGKAGQDVWSEIWDIVGAQLRSVLATGQATWSDDQLLLVNRYGFIEEAYFTYSYSPIFLENGTVGGAFTAVAETTQRVVGERRLATLRNLAAQTGQSQTVVQAYQKAMGTLSENAADIPLALLYRWDAQRQQAILQAKTHVDSPSLLIPEVVDLGRPHSHALTSILAIVVQTSQPAVLQDFGQQWGSFPVGTSQIPLQQGIALPIRTSTPDALVGMLVIGVNPYQALDDAHRNFLDMTVGHIAHAIASAQAYEAERQRAESLAELDRAKTTFFSNISHEFRTPLTLMLSPLEEMLATEAALSEAQRQQLQLIHRNSLRLLKLVNTLLDFSRIEAGRVQAIYQPTNLAALTTELASVFRSAIEQAGLQFMVACDPLPEAIFVDREMWEKIVLNLLSNAFKFTFTGAIAVTLRQQQNQVELRVRDTGIGIPPKELPHLFERFHRVEGAQGRTQEGSGIGLALVQELVKLHGGQVLVDSTEGEGTTFIVTIPIGIEHLPANRIRATPTLSSTALGTTPYLEEALRWLPEESNGPSRQSEVTGQALNDNHYLLNSEFRIPNATEGNQHQARVLLVDDNADMRLYLQRLLLNQGYEVETATDGMAALTAIQQQRPDLVLTDVMMPRLDGFGLLRELRATPATQDIPVILLSARAGEEARVEGLEAGADDYLIKPFSAREVLARVEASLKLTRLRRQAEITLRESEVRFRLLAETIQDVFWMTDFRQLQILYVSPAYEQVWGRSRTEIYQNYNAFLDTIHPDDRERVAMLATVAQDDDPGEQEYRIVRPDGAVRWIRDRGFAVRDETGQIQQVVGIAQDITDHKQAIAALQKSEAKFRRLVEVSMFGVAIGDFSGNILYANNALLNMIGYSREELETGQIRWLELTPPDQVHLDWQAGEELRQRGVAKVFEKEYFHKDGHRVPVLIGGALLGEPYAEQEQIICFYLDLTELKQTNTALRESEERLRLALMAANQGLYDLNVQTGDAIVSPEYARMLGYEPEEFEETNAKWRDRLHPDDVTTVYQTYEDYIAGRCDIYQVEFRQRTKSGDWKWILSTGKIVAWDAHGQPLRMLGTHTDITDRKQAEAALLQSEERLRLALSVSSAGIWDWDILENRITWSEKIYEFHGLTPDTFGGRVEDFAQLIHPDDQERMSEAIRQALEEKAPYEIEFRSVQPSGVVRWLSTSGGAIFNEQGQPIRMLGATRDITERKAIEAERERLLTSEQQAREAAEAANRIKDEFLAILSHELRSPLNPILGWSKLLQAGQLNEQTSRHALATIERNAKLQTQLIDDLLDISRILRGKMNLNIAPINLATVIESALETVRLAADAKHLQIRISIPPHPQQVAGDGTRLQQIVWNLLANAVKFTPDGGQITVCLEPLGHYAQIQVKDTGKGIHPDFLPYVFDYFRQEDGKITRKFGGLGLGLAIVRHLTELHGGTVQAHSLGAGQGATFTVTLPLMATASESGGEIPTLSTDVDFSHLRFLVVDDDADMRELVQIILEQQGGQVTIAASALEALAVFDQHLPDVLISDIGMPDMDGYMLMQQIRERSPEQGGIIPAIALTAYAGEYNERQALKVGFQQHIAKPVEPDVLIQAIAQLLR